MIKNYDAFNIPLYEGYNSSVVANQIPQSNNSSSTAVSIQYPPARNLRIQKGDHPTVK